MKQRAEQKDPSLGNHLPSTCPSADILEYELAFLVRRIEAARRQFHFGLNRSSYLLLRLLERNDRQSVGALADQVNLQDSTVTRQAAVMKRAGLVEKHDNPDDRRSCFVAITEAGRHAVAAVRERRLQRIEYSFRDWPVAERRNFARLLARYNDSLRNMLDEEE